MLKRIRMNVAFEKEVFEKQAVKDMLKDITKFIKNNGIIINQRKDNEEKPVFDVHDCRNGSGEACSNFVNLLK